MYFLDTFLANAGFFRFSRLAASVSKPWPLSGCKRMLVSSKFICSGAVPGGKMECKKLDHCHKPRA
jgi:hypothetical protein